MKMYSQNLVPGVRSFNSKYGEDRAPDRAKMERVVSLQDEHAHAPHDVVEDNHQDADPADGTEPAD